MRYSISIPTTTVVSIVLTASLMIAIGTNYYKVQGVVVRDSETLLLDGQTVSPNGFIHLYDSTPYKITSGHVAAHFVCDMASTTPLHITIGKTPNLTPANLTLVPELSNPGTICLYHADIPPNATFTVTEIAIHNPLNSNIVFPVDSTVVIGVNEIEPLGLNDTNKGIRHNDTHTE